MQCISIPFLLQPSVSVGNLGQLAADVILASVKPARVAAVDHPALLPVVGADPLDERDDHLMTACEGKLRVEPE
jgi:hypothetical protein